jgi:hypothetical protein
MTRANLPHFGRPFDTELSENEVRAMIQAQGNFQSIQVEWPLLIQNTGTGGMRLRIDPAFESRGSVVAASTGVSSRYFKIIRHSDDFTTDRSDVIPCVSFDPTDLEAEAEPGEPVIWVAKIWFLRGFATWNGKTRRNIQYSYQLFTHHTRTATFDPDGTPESETQVIVPSYSEGDVIRATRMVTGLTTAVDNAVNDRAPVVWEEDASGRMWQVLP